MEAEASVWEPNGSLYVLMAICLYLSLGIPLSFFASLFSSSHVSNAISSNAMTKSSSPFDPSTTFSLRFQRKFLLLYSLASALEGMWSVFGEIEFVYYGAKKDDILASLCVGYTVALLVGPLLGVLSDLIGHKKACLFFSIIHLAVGVWKRITSYPNQWFSSLCLPIATSIFSSSFEAMLVTEFHEQSHKHETLTETFWLMTFLESAMLIGTQALSNKLLSIKMERGITTYSSLSLLFSITCIMYLSKGRKAIPCSSNTRTCTAASYLQIINDKRLLVLGLSHTCLQFSICVFWFLWAPTLMADGRGVNFGMIYACLMGSKMVGSAIFQWIYCGSSSSKSEDALAYSFLTLAIVLSIVAYDYQEIKVLVTLFCLFQVGTGFTIPLLARLRAMHVPNEIRGGMITLCSAPGNAMLLFLMIKRGYYRTVENSTMVALASLGLFVAGGCVCFLRRGNKLLYQNGHKL